MSNNSVMLRLAYSNEVVNRTSMVDEINFLLDLNKLLDQHKHLGVHNDSVTPIITHEREGEFGANVNLKFVIRHRKGVLYEYSRLHYLLMEIAELCERYKDKFIRMERYLEIATMKQPWALVAGPQSCLMRKGAATWNATGDNVPAFVNMHQQTDGLVVMGEPKAVEHFRRVWEFHTRTYFESMDPDERAELEVMGTHYGTDLCISTLRLLHPNIKWEHLLIWAHAMNIPGNEGWYVTNLDHTDPWLLAGVQYVNRHGETMIGQHLPYTPLINNFRGADLRFFKDLEVVGFDTTEATVSLDD